MKKRKSHSKFLSLVLRHKPEVAGIVLNENGWVKISELLKGMKQCGRKITRSELQQIVDSCDKQRFAISDNGQMIRASQGHSVDIDLQLKPQKPPNKLFHGTIYNFVGGIWSDGIVPMSRKFVHLSADKETAIKVGQRRGKPVVVMIDAKTMHEDGFDFYCSDNNVWLVHWVPSKFIKVEY